MRLRVLAAAALAAAIAIPLAVASPAFADDYPSWDDVQAAKANQAATQAELDKINGLIQQLQTASAQAANDELQKAASYTQAKNDLSAATQKEQSLQTQAAAAATDAATAKKRFGQLVSQLYVSGGSDPSMQLFLNKQDSNSLLDKLGAMSQLTGHSSQLQKQAVQKENLATSLQKQAVVAEQTRQTLATDAQQKLEAATAAKEATDAQLAQQQTVGQTLVAQAASLQNIAVQTEQQYEVGQQVKQQQEDQEAAANSSSSTDDSTYVDTDGVTVDPAAAQAYASSVLGNYGWSQSQMGCLVDLWNQESGWRANAYNESSGAYGIPQSLPASKMASAGADWRTNAQTQINWGLTYIANAYGSPCAAWNHEMSENPHWY